MKLLLWIVVLSLRSPAGSCGSAGVVFTKHPSNQTVSQGNEVRLGCAVEGVTEPEITWMKDGEKLYSTDQVFLTLGEQHWETSHSVKSVQQQDAGQYWCEVEFHGLTFSSERAWITVEGVPHFTQEPQDVAMFAGTPFNLTCAAIGPPEPVEVLWWLGGVQEGEPRPSPSILHVPVPSAAPRNLTFDLSEQQLFLKWAELQVDELQGRLLAYKVQWTVGGEAQEPLLFKENSAHLSGGGRFFNASFQVAACTAVGCGPWSSPVLLLPPSAQVRVPRSHMWVGLLLGLLVATIVGLLLAVVAQRRGKEMQFGSAFKSPGAETSVSFTAARSFNRNVTDLQESTLDGLCINDELKNKLKDVLISERRLTLGHMLGKGEFGSVREAFLKTEDSSVQKVAVKVLKSDITSSGDIEQCLKEAAYMKDFHHPNVIQLIGVSLHRRPGQRLPIPMVVLPFMKHGDLHTFLLLSRLGDEPFDLSLHTLVRFMLDISQGMEYLSSKNIIHRDLAARNCMLNEDMTVCVADFGLSKKIYSGDYYRQGSVSKLPVKWIALESLADNVYTTQSDVWAFGVTMWEIMTRGQTPYPGVENSEIYEFLIKGERLKKPADCRDDIYEIMHSCWSPVPKCRPSFQQLVGQLEALWVSLLPASPQKEPLFYVNLEGDNGEHGEGARAQGPEEAAAASNWGVPWQRQVEHEEKDWLIGSGAAFAIGGDYRYITGPCGVSEEEAGGRWPTDTLQEEARDEDDDDVVINV
ncbi:tyrosine-protein kinase receptor TYRO3 isoform X5 [Astatotilapia calliptera]|uniref:tyrosine-protein kinase receptor TYRO3 isoform X5 n=1 Tax=Astatotilapia calliptera TaxID=8154 RepID=UPI000E414ED8|nr:tyrosine-protein kinase receptor TYRO3 isoform X5 [Astatotilapia calliptera]